MVSLRCTERESLTARGTVVVYATEQATCRGAIVRENCEMTPIALRDLAVLLFLAVMLICVLLALRATQPESRRRRE
jgi:hypothetical protein